MGSQGRRAEHTEPRRNVVRSPRPCLPTAGDPAEEACQEGSCGAGGRAGRGVGGEAGEPLHLRGLPDVVACGDVGRRARGEGKDQPVNAQTFTSPRMKMSSESSHFY